MSEVRAGSSEVRVTATEKLRRLLDERGVEWRRTPHYSSESQDNETIFEGNGIEWYANDHLNGRLGLRTARYEVTPEQAIDATLGATDAKPTQEESSETCHVESSIIDTYEYNRWEYELSCGHTIIWEDSEPPRYCPRMWKENRAMSITDELRAWAEGDTLRAGMSLRTARDQALAIADRIDAEHQKALDEWKAEHGQMWLKGYAECHAELLDGNETLASDLERCGWIRLPKDADGEYIHIGDALDGYGKTIEVVELRHGRSGWVLISRDGNGYADCAAFTHHHAPTVEDVLREFTRDWCNAACAGDMTNAERDAARANTIAEFAAKLRLAEDNNGLYEWERDE